MDSDDDNLIDNIFSSQEIKNEDENGKDQKVTDDIDDYEKILNSIEDIPEDHIKNVENTWR